MNKVIEARGLRKRYGKTEAVKGVDLSIEAGKIVGLIGPNGAGKTSVLKAMLGLTDFEGELSVLGRNPHTERHALMQDVCFIADVAVLPRWIRVREAIEYVEGVHARFSRAKCEAFLAKTKLKPEMRVREMSKGMIVQLHLALVMAIDAKLLVLDEPTLGLDVLYRKDFYQTLLNDYLQREDDHRHYAPGRGDRTYPDRRVVHQGRRDLAVGDDGRAWLALHRGDGAGRQAPGRAGVQAAGRTSGLRQVDPALRRRVARSARCAR
jgi:ABC-type Mn2+/Zn2+ transport system ATPase subunit